MKLEQRAARYFGVHDEPRNSVKTSRWECLVVARLTKKGIALMYYTEANSNRPSGEYWWLTESERKALIEALGGSPHA